MSYDTKTLEAMENTAREHADCSCSKRINGKWLDVTLYAANGICDEYFKYLYDGKQINRIIALKLFGSK